MVCLNYEFVVWQDEFVAAKCADIMDGRGTIQFIENMENVGATLKLMMLKALW